MANDNLLVWHIKLVRALASACSNRYGVTTSDNVQKRLKFHFYQNKKDTL